MGELKKPPTWGGDELTRFIDAAHHNTYATYWNCAREYTFLNKVDSLFFEIVKNLGRNKSWLSSLFVMKCHSKYRAASRLALSGQASETYLILRGCLEDALYANHINLSGEAGKIWAERELGDKQNKKCRREFTLQNVLVSLEKTNHPKIVLIKNAYDLTISRGAHPNIDSLAQSLSVKEEEKDVYFSYKYMTGDTGHLATLLKITAYVGVLAISVFEKVFPERFAIVGVSDEVDFFFENVFKLLPVEWKNL